jgi:PST family polysaccharide transporter
VAGNGGASDSSRNGDVVGDLGRHAARGSLTAIHTQIYRVLVQIAGMALLARLLTPRDFGLIAMATTVTSFAGMFADMGLSTATVQQKKIENGIISALFYINVGMGVGLALLCVAIAPIIAWIYGDDRLIALIIVLGLSFPVANAGMQHAALLQRRMIWGSLQWAPVIAQAIAAIVAVALAWLTNVGYWALVVQLWASTIVLTSLYWMSSGWRPSVSPDWRNARLSVQFGIRMMAYYFLNYFHRHFDKFLVGQSWGTLGLGYYSRAYQLLLLPITLIEGPIASVILPVLSRLQDDRERWNAAFMRVFLAANLLSSAFSTMLISSAEPLVQIVYGSQWRDAGPVFLYLSISLMAATPFNALTWVLVSLGQPHRLRKWGCIVTPIIVASFLAGLPYGPKGVALCYSIVMCLIAIPGIFFMSRSTPIRVLDCIFAWLPLSLSAMTSALATRFIFQQLELSNNIVLTFVMQSIFSIIIFGSIVLLLIKLRLPVLRDIVHEPIVQRLAWRLNGFRGPRG